MKAIIREQNKYVLRFDPGEEVLGGIRQYCHERQIQAGVFTGLGAISEVLLAYYEPVTKVYQDRTFQQEMEITSLTGNVSRWGEETVVHAHGSFSDKNFESWGGHIKKLIVSATCEVFLERLSGRIDRSPDEKTGLNLMR